jgi:hypothetical protein
MLRKPTGSHHFDHPLTPSFVLVTVHVIATTSIEGVTLEPVPRVGASTAFGAVGPRA